jgi:Flp pilus assembly protein TadG
MSIAGGCRAALTRARAFLKAKNGNVAMIFALSLIPMCIAAGTGLDFSRALIVRARLAEALDAAGLAVGASKGLSQSQLDALAQDYFNANYTADSSFGTPTPVAVNPGTLSVSLSTTVQMPTTLMNIVGVKTMDVSYTSQIVWGQTKLWVSLVLDNTGSMSQTDSTGTTKMDALKTATHQLLQILQNAAGTPGDVKVALIPFNRDVNVGSPNSGATWLDWSDWNNSNGTCAGAYTYHSTDTKSKCEYYGGTWTAADHSSWDGCVMDRTQDYDTQNTNPVASNTATLFPVQQYSSCPAQMQAMTYDWTALSNEVDAMYPTGNTNQTIGMAWGWQALTDGDPMHAGTLPPLTKRVIILLSDGVNTQNRWTSSQSSIDDRERLACDNAKAEGITIYTVFVDLNGTSGSSAALEYCASDPSKYFDLTTTGQIVTAFNAIGQQIANLRVAQ